ncbi:MAG TPA: hypothetical protein PL051_03910 [Candidatus Saccharibacteria bacterium]|nr:hypothetical protein [Candidatus Saccharibacteria bacterium]
MSSGNRQNNLFVEEDRQALASSRNQARNRSRLEANYFYGLNQAEESIRNLETDFEARFKAFELDKQKDIEKIKVEIESAKSEVRQARNKILEPLAVFVGLFTFASIAFQTFAQIREYILWMPILVIVLGAMIIFAGLVIHASSIDADVSKRRTYTGLLIATGLILIIAGGAYYGAATDIIGREDSKYCIRLIKDEVENNPWDLYCKIKR